jgi:hypothetical protein
MQANRGSFIYDPAKVGGTPADPKGTRGRFDRRHKRDGRSEARGYEPRDHESHKLTRQRSTRLHDLRLKDYLDEMAT